MQPHAGTRALAVSLGGGRSEAKPPPVLVLGDQCADAAGIPPISELARQSLEHAAAFINRTPLLRTFGIELPDSDADDEALTRTFLEVVTRSPVGPTAVLGRLTWNVPVPLFYQELAALVRDRYFSTVVTTGHDTLLERALDAAGMRVGADYRVVAPALESASPAPSPDDDGPSILLLKLFGPGPLELDLPDVLSAGAVVVGYSGEIQELTSALSTTAPLWWVASARPEPPLLDQLPATDAVRWIDGPSAEPDRFAGELAVRLLNLPRVNLLKRSLREALPGALALTLSTATGLQAAGGIAAATVAALTRAEDDAEFEEQFVRGRRRRCQATLLRLEEEVGTGDRPDWFTQQLEYQRRQLVELEARLRALKTSRTRLLALLTEIEEAATGALDPEHAAAADAETLEYLRSLIETIRGEYAREGANQAILGANVAAVRALAEGLNVDERLIGRLADFAPTTPRAA
jgi:hypothetical protein